MIGSANPKRVATIVVLCALGALGGVVSTFALAVCVTGVLTVLALSEYEPLIRRLRPGAATPAAATPSS